MSVPVFRSRYHSIRMIVKIFLLAGVAAALAIGVGGCSDNSSESTNSFDIGTGPITNRAKDPISRDAVEKLVTRKLGDAGVQGQPVIRSVVLTPEANGTSLTIDLNRTASCHSGALVGSAVTMAQQVMSALFRYPDVSQIQLTLYGPTEAAQDRDKQAVRIVVTKDAAAKIDWFQFKETTVASLATEYWIEPAVKENYLLYGSAVITDPALLQQANSGAASTTTPATP